MHLCILLLRKFLARATNCVCGAYKANNPYTPHATRQTYITHSHKDIYACVLCSAVVFFIHIVFDLAQYSAPERTMETFFFSFIVSILLEREYAREKSNIWFWS